jgi:hypothetical protein
MKRELSFSFPAKIQYRQEKWLKVEFWSCSYAVFSYLFEYITIKTIIPQVMSFLHKMDFFKISTCAGESMVQW